MSRLIIFVDDATGKKFHLDHTRENWGRVRTGDGRSLTMYRDEGQFVLIARIKGSPSPLFPSGLFLSDQVAVDWLIAHDLVPPGNLLHLAKIPPARFRDRSGECSAGMPEERSSLTHEADNGAVTSKIRADNCCTDGTHSADSCGPVASDSKEFEILEALSLHGINCTSNKKLGKEIAHLMKIKYGTSLKNALSSLRKKGLLSTLSRGYFLTSEGSEVCKTLKESRDKVVTKSQLGD